MMSQSPSFSWKRELPVMALPMVVGLLVRVWASIHPAMYYSSDTAIIDLMVKHIWVGERYPLLYYGNNYIGTLEAYLAAPWVGLFGGGSTRAFATSQSLLWALSVPLFYRLFFRIGGRAGALAGALVLSVGSSWLIFVTGGELMGYLGALSLGCWLFLSGLAFADKPGPWRALGCGLLVGVGYWTSPQVVLFVAPLAVVLWARGRTVTLIEQGALRETLGGRFWPVLIAVGLAALAVPGSFVLCLLGPVQVELGLFSLSLGKPWVYIARTGALLGGLLAGLELLLADDAGRWIRRMGLFAFGALVGVTPLLVAKARHTGAYAVSAPTYLDVSVAARKVKQLPDTAGIMLYDYPVPPGLDGRGGLAQVRRVLRWGMILLSLLGLLAVIVAHRAEWWRLITLRTVALSPMSLLVLLGGALLGLFLLHVGPAQVRYFIYGWLVLGGVISWCAGWLYQARPRLTVALVSVVLLYYASTVGLIIGAHMPRIQTWDQAVIRSLEQRGMRHGYASYWWAYRLMFLSDERLKVGVFDPEMIGGHDAGANRLPWVRREVDRQRDVFVVFNFEPPSLPTERDGEAAFLERFKGKLVERWRVGPYRCYRVRWSLR